MNTIYLKFTSGYDLQGGHNDPSMGYVVKNIVSDITESTNDTIFSISSVIYNKAELLTRFNNYGFDEELTELETYLLGKVLRPDESDPDYSFDNVISMDIVKARTIKNNDINLRTITLINKGHKWNGEWFSCSDNAQKYWTAKRLLKDNGSLTADLSQYNKDDTVKVSITNSNIVSFTDDMDAVIQGHKDSGETIKDSVIAIMGTDITAMQEISDITDTR